MSDDYETAMRDPGDVFDSPRDVLDSDFSTEQKRNILRSWEDQAEKRQIATAEGMARPGSVEDSGRLLADIADALRILTN